MGIVILNMGNFDFRSEQFEKQIGYKVEGKGITTRPIE